MKKRYYLLLILPFLIIALLYEIIPLVMLLFDSFQTQTSGVMSFSLQNYKDIFTTLSYSKAIKNSLTISVWSSCIGIIVAFLAAKAAYSSKGAIKKVYVAVLNMTSNFAGIPLAFAFILILGNTGVLRQIAQKYGISFINDFSFYSSSGLRLLYVYFQIPLAVLLLIPSFDGIQKEWFEANVVLGGTKYDFWLKIGIPVLLPSVLSTISVLFANSLTAYETAYALLANNYSLLPLNISSAFVNELGSKANLGAALSIIMMLIMCAVILFNNFLTKKLVMWRE